MELDVVQLFSKPCKSGSHCHCERWFHEAETGHRSSTSHGRQAWFLSSLSAVLFHSAVRATVLNQATPSYVIEGESSFYSGCSDVDVSKNEGKQPKICDDQKACRFTLILQIRTITSIPVILISCIIYVQSATIFKIYLRTQHILCK